MITNQDVKKLKSVFATKDDLKSMEDRQNKRFATKDDLKRQLKPIKKSIDKLTKSINLSIKFTNEETTKIKKRVNRIEDHLGLPPIVAS